MPWKRPADVPLGQVWRRFSGRDRNGEPARKYQIRDMDEKHRDSYVDFLQATFLKDEPLCKVFNILSDPPSVATIKTNWHQFLDQNVSLACYSEDEEGRPEELVAFAICLVKSIDDVEDDEDFDQINGESWKKLLQVLIAIGDCCNVFKHFGVDSYFTSDVLAVSPAHRGQNIGAEMFRATETLSKALGIPAMATAVTALASQAIMRKCGYELIAEMPYSRMSERSIDLSSCDTPTAQVLGLYFGCQD